ncbi:MAG: HTH domain-containing protein [Christensenellaceae bacterium]
MTANERRKRILEVLCLRRSDTRENLANEFGVSSRTIERDVATLSLELCIRKAFLRRAVSSVAFKVYKV